MEKGRGERLRADVAAMRARLAEAKPGHGAWEAKLGPGRMMDVELAGQMLAMLAGSAARGTEAQIQAGILAGLVSETDATLLRTAYRLCWRVQAARRLLSDKGGEPAALGEGGRAFVQREAGAEDLTLRLKEVTQRAAVVIDRMMRR